VPTTATPRFRLSLAIVALILPLLVVLISWALWRQELPPEVASHWSGTGVADDTLPTMGVLTGVLITTGVAAVGGILFCVFGTLSARQRRNIVFMFGFLGGISTAVWLIPAHLTIQAGSAAEAVLGWWIVVLMLLPLYGLIPAALLPRPLAERPATLEQRADSERSSLEIKAGENDTYTAGSLGWIFVWCTVGLVILGGFLYGTIIVGSSFADNAVGILVLGFAILICVAFSYIRVSVDHRGLRVTSGIFGIPLKRIHLHQIDFAEGADLRAMEWGGWGYRITAGRSAIILRSGPGLIVGTVNGKEFGLTLAKPEEPAYLLNALRDNLPASRDQTDNPAGS